MYSEMPSREKYSNVAWKQDAQAFELWREGRTGFPIVDAGMRQLNQTGFMHNRVRMVVASFLTKDVHDRLEMGRTLLRPTPGRL